MKKHIFTLVSFVPGFISLASVGATSQNELVKARPLPLSNVRLLGGPLKQAQDILEGKEKVTVRFQAGEGNVVAAVFGIRMIRADAER